MPSFFKLYTSLSLPHRPHFNSTLMGYLSCNADSAIAACDPYNWDRRRRRKGKTRSKNKSGQPVKIREFLYDELVAATKAFSADNFLGKGSHGSVYKAVLDDGKLIAAVKKTTSPISTSQDHHPRGNCSNSPAENEIEILSRVNNPRLVNLIGFCVDSREKKLLVVEYMPRGSLFELLHCSSRPPGWTRRVRFALQIAEAVQCLHTSSPPVIHRDIKSSNVLIDESGDARLGDFGLALRGHVEDVRVKCTPPAGTLGYLDPGYLAPGDLSTKSDVFSFGILLLEIISGRHAIDLNYSPPSVVDWAVPIIKHGEFSGICDHRLRSLSDRSVIRALAVLAARCVRSTAAKRPDMAEVIDCLKNVRKKFHSPPGWCNLRRVMTRLELSESSAQHDPVEKSEDVVITSSARCGSRRNRKVSSVTSVDSREGSGDRVIRSRSIGCLSEARVEPDLILGGDGDEVGPRRKKHGGLALKMAAVRLRKSRSMGVLQSRKALLHHGGNDGKGYVSDMKMQRRKNNTSKLVITRTRLDEKSEKELQKKPLVSS